MTLFRNLLKTADKFLCTKRCDVFHQNSWNIENYFGSKIEIPSPPKRPLSAYMIFCKENRENILKENPCLSTPDQIRVLAKKWSHLTEDMKKPYELSARQNTQVYGEEHKKFYESLTEEQKEELARLKAKKLESRRLLKLKKDLRASGVPKGPSSAYAIFIQAEAKNKPIVNHASEFIKKAAEVWKSMSEDRKKVYEMQAQEEKAFYAKEMKDWRAKMLSEGKTKLLRAYDELKGRGKLADPKKPGSTKK